MIRLTINIPKSVEDCLIYTRGDVAKLLSFLLKQKGVKLDPSIPAQWGFGVIAESFKDSQSQFKKLRRIIVGSSSDVIVQALKNMTVQDFQSANQRLNFHMNFSQMTLRQTIQQLHCESIDCRCVSPIHVKNHIGETLLEFNHHFTQSLNHTMSNRFQRPFQLQFELKDLDSLKIATMAHGVQSNGKLASNKGLLFRFTLKGTVQEINDAFFNGIGAKTARGFGCINLD